MFRLIALRPLEGVSDYALKCLHIDETYYFCNYFVIAEDGRVSWREGYKTIPYTGLYRINGGPSEISMSAIVGKNGDGKSSIVELMMRLINNYAASSLNMMKAPGALVKVKGVCAELFFMIGDSFYKLYDEEGNGYAKLEKIARARDNGRIESYRQPEEINEHSQLASNFFYTMVSNYSHYAYNIYDFRNEWIPAYGLNQTSDERCWLFHIFHKNDGYRTPLVLNPYRSRGIIDINREAFLTQQRLISLFLDAETPGQGVPTFREMYGKVASHIVLEDPESSKLQEKTIKEFFIWVKNDVLLGDIISRTKMRSHHLDDGGEVYINADECLKLMRTITHNWITPNRTLLKKILQWDREDKAKRNAIGEERGYLSDNSDLKSWIIELKQANFGIRETEKNRLLADMEPYKDFNVSQLQRIGLINIVCKAVAGKIQGCQVSVEDQFSLTSREIATDYDQLTMRQKCEHYIIYKIISIFETYTQEYKKPHKFYSSLINGNLKIPRTYVLNAVDKLWADIKNNPSHITLKLRQALYYRRYYLIGHGDKFEELNIRNYDEAARINAILNQGRQTEEEKSYMILPLDVLKREIADCHNLEQLPPPIYFTHVVFTSQDDDDKVMTMDTLSSGEKQRLMTISGIIYHLRNINTIDNEGIKYHYVNVVLEEIELYFHPESQRLFIKEMVEMIERANFTNIPNIHVLFITHSPFVLSDIPSDNVLMLEKGRTAKIESRLQTFGANIYDMLDTGFFMEKGAIGEFASFYIRNIVNTLNEWGDYMEKGEDRGEDIPIVSREELRKMILVVDDRVIRESLMIRYDDIFQQKMTVEDEIRELNERIARLEEKRRNHVVSPEA